MLNPLDDSGSLAAIMPARSLRLWDWVYTVAGPWNFMPKPSPPNNDEINVLPNLTIEYSFPLFPAGRTHARNNPLSTSNVLPALRSWRLNPPYSPSQIKWDT